MIPLVLDWDGTVTERDGLDMIVRRFGDPAVFERMTGLFGTLTLEQVIAAEIETIRAPLDEVVAWVVENVRIRPGFAELVRERDPLIVSAGFHELIAPVLEREGIGVRGVVVEADVPAAAGGALRGASVRLIANRLDSRPGGWGVVFREKGTCSVCGERCKRGDVPTGVPYVYVGDGLSDRCVSVAASRRFARTGLARWLDEQAIPYEPFADLHEIRAALDRDPPTP
ncbi:MAG: hypothetical protein EXQ77_02810 [Thermoleophilia bacterium]|nr:hypothetical protein [Thermoleophilia bacterium]